MIDILRDIKTPIFYVTNDAGKAIGLEKLLPNYHIVCLDYNSIVDLLLESGISLFCLEKNIKKKNVFLRNTGVILNHPLVISFIREKSRGEIPHILFFKPQKRIEKIAQEHGFKLIGNTSDINQLFEDKISFYKLCLKYKIPVPEGEVGFLYDLSYDDLKSKYGNKLIIQFGRGWAGNSTFIISSENELKKIKNKSPNFQVKVSKFIEGMTLINNAVVYNNRVLISEPGLQIKPHPLLTSTQTGTGGRIWPIGVSSKIKDEITKITSLVGKMMSDSGFRGFFGLDFVVDQNNKVYLIENNARLTYSVPFYTKLELEAKIFPLLGWHLLSFLNKNYKDDVSYSFQKIKGSEIVVRNVCKSKIIFQNEMPTGIYNQNLDFIKKSYYLDASNDKYFWISTVAPGRIVNPEIEYCKICTRDTVVDKNGNLKSYYSKLIEKINHRLNYKYVE